MNHSIHPLTPILGTEAGAFARLLDQLVPRLDGIRYAFPAVEDITRKPIPRINQIYWTQLLYRAHWTASGTLIRAHRWLSGILAAHTQLNLLTFAASARGLIEAAADSHHGLSGVALTLARDHQMVRSAIEGTLLAPAVNPELEDQLIHFTHARKPAKGESIPESQVALQVSQYRRVLDDVEPAVAECYWVLCDLTHPGASSVLSYASPAAPDGAVVELSFEAERERARSSGGCGGQCASPGCDQAST